MPASPMKLTMDLLQQAGWTVTKVEVHEPYTHRTRDFLGVADLLAQAVGRPKMLVQVTGDDTGGHYQDRKRKVLGSDDARTWVETGGDFMVITWKRPVKNKQKVNCWESRYEMLTIADFTAADAAGATR